MLSESTKLWFCLQKIQGTESLIFPSFVTEISRAEPLWHPHLSLMRLDFIANFPTKPKTASPHSGHLYAICLCFGVSIISSPWGREKSAPKNYFCFARPLKIVSVKVATENLHLYYYIYVSGSICHIGIARDFFRLFFMSIFEK